MTDKKIGKKILVIGLPGSGKTTLSKKLRKLFQLPVYHLDDYYWKEDWVAIPDIQWEKKLNHILNKKKWILDGHYQSTLPQRIKKADTVIFLNFSQLVCLLRIFKRAFLQYFGLEKEILPRQIRQARKRKSQPVFPKWIELILMITKFRSTKIKEIISLRRKKQKGFNFYIFKNNGEVNQFIKMSFSS